MATRKKMSWFDILINEIFLPYNLIKETVLMKAAPIKQLQNYAMVLFNRRPSVYTSLKSAAFDKAKPKRLEEAYISFRFCRPVNTLPMGPDSELWLKFLQKYNQRIYDWTRPSKKKKKKEK